MKNPIEILDAIQELIKDCSSHKRIEILTASLGSAYLLHLLATNRERDEEAKDLILTELSSSLEDYEKLVALHREEAKNKGESDAVK